jgi:dipeptidyl aminopeptidase/acylaminoacyl peptidase
MLYNRAKEDEMKKIQRNHLFYVAIAVLVLLPTLADAQGKLEDYERADSYRSKLRKLVYHSVDRVNWINESNRFWYRVNTREGQMFFLLDAEKKTKKPVFDHKKLVQDLAKLSGKEIKPDSLPFQTIEFSKDMRSVSFKAHGYNWIYTLKTRRLEKGEEAPESDRPRRSEEVKSPDKKWLAFIRDHNLFIRSTETAEEFQLSRNGTEENYYERISWSPDSNKIAIFQFKRGLESTVHLIESSPKDQFLAKTRSRTYQLPGDVLDIPRPCVFFVENKQPVKVDLFLNPAPWGMRRPIWNKNSKDFILRYQERGEKLARAYHINASSGTTRMILEEKADTFIDRYNAYLEYTGSTDEIIWSSERDGWRHLYLYDTKEGQLKNQITEGEWVVRGIIHTDEKARQVYFRASGREPDEDPYFIHYYRVNFDGTHLTNLTPEPGNHSLSFSHDKKLFVDTHSRIDLPPVTVLRRSQDGSIVMEVEKADIQDLLSADWKMPEPFVTKGRDGKTDIWGMIYRPINFDSSKNYPVIEYIYAGPHGSHVPKSFRADRGQQALTELGFIVVQMDGMGTANRSKAFHDVAWKNIADAGFPDRILWIKAAAKKYPYMDISRVGIYGTSAGGQNSTAAVLFHPEFYDVAVSSCGCHDNRMDKAVWNEQWMGYPVGPHYAEQSNVTNASQLVGKLLLIVGEVDTNVPPESTLKVVDALIKAKKDFDLLVLPGVGHSSGGEYGERRRRDFFVKHLMGVSPPDWNKIEKKEEK